MQLTVAVIGAAHGLKGEVRLDVRTDIPERRLAPGTMLETDPAEVGPLTVERTRQYKGATYATFVECHNRTAAEQIRGVKLTVETDEDEIEEDDAWYAHELVGLEVLDPEGYTLGEVIGLEPMPAQDLLVVREPDGLIARVPMAREIVTEVDLDDGCVVVDAPPGLFSDDELIIVGAADDARNSHGHDRPRPSEHGAGAVGGDQRTARNPTGGRSDQHGANREEGTGADSSSHRSAGTDSSGPEREQTAEEAAS
ncbi:ribosome maturation factor RimM [Actinobaculum sp. 352]|uniref:ribosome maturation factor RimM n=1 Tax=Actinobaculum sp. 352 TaxID=2490946 RepID=UPI000F7DE4B2|nr:ribosome maturation factor RimM [Actinobaculum sp. 352]